MLRLQVQAPGIEGLVLEGSGLRLHRQVEQRAGDWLVGAELPGQ